MRKLLFLALLTGLAYAFRRPIGRALTRATGTWVGSKE